MIEIYLKKISSTSHLDCYSSFQVFIMDSKISVLPTISVPKARDGDGPRIKNGRNKVRLKGLSPFWIWKGD